MKQMLEERWRQPMWTRMMSRLPATITTNMKTKSYAVRDNLLQFIYTDDIDEGGVDDMMQGLAETLNPASRREFRFDLLDINALLPERIFRADEYGES